MSLPSSRQPLLIGGAIGINLWAGELLTVIWWTTRNTFAHHRPDTAVRGVIWIQFLSDLTDNIGDGGIAVTIRFLLDRFIYLLFAEYPTRVFCQVTESKKLIVTHGNKNATLIDSLFPYMNLQIRERTVQFTVCRQ